MGARSQSWEELSDRVRQLSRAKCPACCVNGSACTLHVDVDVKSKDSGQGHGVIRIGELAKRSGVSTRALRYYEEQRLIEAQRSPSGQRYYDETAIEKVRFFQLMFAAGLTSRNIAVLLPCIDTGRTTEAQRRMLDAERERVRTNVEQLQLALGRLEEIIALAAERSDSSAPTPRRGK